MRRQRKQEIAALKRALTATHFRLEDGNGEVGSDSSRKLQPQKEGHGRLLSLPPVKTLKELRALGSSHFTFCEAGDCPEDRQASVMGAATAATAAATAAGGVGVGERERGRARELKRELTASRIVLGVDPAYA